MKWVGIFQVGIFQGEFDGWEFSPGGIFLEPQKNGEILNEIFSFTLNICYAINIVRSNCQL